MFASALRSFHEALGGRPLPHPHPETKGASAIAAALTEHRINERIRAREVRLIDSDGSQLGIVPFPKALDLAYEQGLDLVEVAADANPPVCKIMDFAKFKYDMAQRAKESRRRATTTTIKEMKYRVKIGIGDFDTKTRQVGKFLGEGHKVKVSIMFRGREMDHPELGLRILDSVAERVADISKVEAAPRRDGRNMVMVLAPDKQKQQAKAKSETAKAAQAQQSADLAAERAEQAEQAEPDEAAETSEE